DEVCGDDGVLRKRIEQFLSAQAEIGTFLEPRTPEFVAVADEPKLDVTGTVIGPYKLLEQIGQGGMGVVYKAEQTALKRTVALKMILHAEYAGDKERQRFQREAEAVARLAHPNIVQIHEVGEHGGVPYFSLEFCAGGSLADQLDGPPWGPPR